MKLLMPAAALLLVAAPVLPAQAPAAPPRPAPSPAAPLDALMAAAEASLRDGELQLAESRYRAALTEGFLEVGAALQAKGRSDEALAAFQHAAASSEETTRPAHSIALLQLGRRDAEAAIGTLTRELARHPNDRDGRLMLAQALVAAGRPAEAVQELEEGHGADPDDAEMLFALAGGYLRVQKPEAAEKLFARLLTLRPIPQTKVLIGRTYRDFGDFDRARPPLEQALAADPRVRHAHYYLGMIDVTDRGTAGLDSAIAHFRKELALSPDEPLINLRLGMALVEARQPAEALPLLRSAAGRPHPDPDALLYLGRCQMALGNAPEAAETLQKAVSAMALPPVDASRLGGAHYQLATALRRLGRGTEAAPHFAAAESTSAERASSSRDDLARYMSDAPTEQVAETAIASLLGNAADRDGNDAALGATEAHARDAVARALFNLGVVHAQAGRFDRAASLLSLGAEVAPAFPQMQRALGVSLFNAGRFKDAARCARECRRRGAGRRGIAADAGARVLQLRRLHAGRQPAARRSGARCRPVAAVHLRRGAGAQQPRR